MIPNIVVLVKSKLAIIKRNRFASPMESLRTDRRIGYSLRLFGHMRESTSTFEFFLMRFMANSNIAFVPFCNCFLLVISDF